MIPVQSTNVVPIAVAKARRRIVDHFCALHAIEAEDAIEFAPQSLIEHSQFDKMRRDGVIVQTLPGYYWLDLDRHKVATERRRRRLVPIVVVGMLIAAWALTLFYRG